MMMQVGQTFPVYDPTDQWPQFGQVWALKILCVVQETKRFCGIVWQKQNLPLILVN